MEKCRSLGEEFMQIMQHLLHNGFSDLWPHTGITVQTEMRKLYEQLLASGGVFGIDPELHSSVLDSFAARPNGSLPASFITAVIQINRLSLTVKGQMAERPQ